MNNVVKNNIFISSIALIIYWFIIFKADFGFDIKKIQGDILLVSNWFWAISPIGILAILFGILGLFAFDHNPKAGEAVTLISMVIYFCTGGIYLAFLILNEFYFLPIWLLPIYLMVWTMLVIPNHICSISAKNDE